MHPRLRQWLLSLVPVSLVAFAAVSGIPPSGDDALILTGDWQASPVQAGVEGPARTVHLPGNLSDSEITSNDVVLRKLVSLPPALQGRELTFAIGFVQEGIFEVFANGRRIGRRGELATNQLSSDSELSTFYVGVVEGSSVELMLRLHSYQVVNHGVLDPRLALGRTSVIEAWAFRGRSLRAMLEVGGLLTLCLVAGLLAVVRQLQPRQGQESGLFSGAFSLIGAALLYLAGISGFPLSLLLGPDGVQAVTLVSIMLLALAVIEFLEAYLLGRVTRFRRGARVVIALTALAMVGGALRSIDLAMQVYTVTIPLVFVAIVYGLWLLIRAVVVAKLRYAPILTVSLLLCAATGISDLMTDLDLGHLPPIYPLSVFNMAIVAAMVVVGEFVGLADENLKLSASLAVRNVELQGALEQAKESDRLKGEFLAVTSHELRTPLNAIINIPLGILESVVERPGAAPSLELELTDVSRLLRSVVTSGQQLHRVVEDLLDFSSLHAERLAINVASVQLGGLLETAHANSAALAKTGQVELLVHPVPSVSLVVDGERITQVIVNLIGNAVKFSAAGQRVEVRAEVRGEEVRVSVHDDGIGIAPEFHQSIFEGFRQVDATRTRRFGGTGVGLALSQRLATLHRGRIEVASALGHGSTFTLVLPLRE